MQLHFKWLTKSILCAVSICVFSLGCCLIVRTSRPIVNCLERLLSSKLPLILASETWLNSAHSLPRRSQREQSHTLAFLTPHLTISDTWTTTPYKLPCQPFMKLAGQHRPKQRPSVLADARCSLPEAMDKKNWRRDIQTGRGPVVAGYSECQLAWRFEIPDVPRTGHDFDSLLDTCAGIHSLPLWLVHTADADETKLSCLVELAVWTQLSLIHISEPTRPY